MSQAEVFNAAFDKLMKDYKDFIPEEATERAIVPTVVACLGGAGALIGARLKGKLKEYYKQVGRDIPENPLNLFRFVVCDTVEYTKLEQEVRDQFTKNDYNFLGGFSPITELKYSSSDDIKSWWDFDYKPDDRNIENGANRIRQLGRLCLYVKRDSVYRNILTAIKEVISLNSKLVASGNARVEGSMQFRLFIISGTCGGTGAGTFIDMSHLMLKAAAECGYPRAAINAMLLMPQLHIQKVAIKQPEIVAALKANAYALFKEIQSLQFNNRERVGTEALFGSVAFDAVENETIRAQKPYTDSRVWSRIFLIDNIVGNSKMINDIPDACELASEALFHYLVLPTGFRDETDVTNSTSLEQVTKYGLPTSFSSIGFSQIIYPAAKLAKASLAKYATDLLQTILKDGGDTKFIEKRANLLKTNQTVGVDFWDRAWDIDSAVTELSDMEEVRTSFGKIEKVQSAVAEVQGLIKRVLENGKRIINDKYSSSEDKLNEAIEKIGEEINLLSEGTSLPTSIASVRMHLNWLEAQKEQMRISEAFDITQIDRVFADVIRIANSVNVLNKGRKKNEFNIALEAAKEKQRYNVRMALQQYGNYKKSEYAGKLIEGINRLLRDAGILKTKLEALADDFRMLTNQSEKDARVPATTTYIPQNCLKDNVPQVECFVSNMMMDIEKDIKKYVVDKTKLMELVVDQEVQEKRVQQFIEGILRDIVNEETTIKEDILGKTIMKKTEEIWPDTIAYERDFVNGLQHVMLEMASPPIQIDWGKAGVKSGATKAYAGGPKFNENDDLSSRIINKVDKESYHAMDIRRISFLRVIHGFPLNAISYLEQYKTDYLEAIRKLTDRSRRNNPQIDMFPHLSKEFNSDTTMPDIAPAPGDFDEEKASLFTQAFFTHWLATMRKQGQYRCIYKMEKEIPVPYEGGIITQKGNYFYTVEIAKVQTKQYPQGILVLQKEKPLRSSLRLENRTVREEAKSNINTRDLEDGLKLYWEQYWKQHNYEEADAETLEYVDYLNGLRLNQTESDTLGKQLKMEADAFNKFMNDEKSRAR